jgi:hypothetical protein
MSFKLNGAPYNKDDMNIAVYRKDLKDGSAGKSNHTGIIVDKDVDANVEKAVVAHETVHQHQQRNGELDYDRNNFYWKGKTYPRENLNEHNEDLPWEKEAYKASNGILNGKNKDMRNKFELKGHRGNRKPFKALSDRKLIGSQDGASAPGGPAEKEKVTKSTKTDINPKTGMKRFTTTTTRQGGSPGSKGTISYEDAYKKADKSKYPTIDSFTKAAKSYKKKDVKVEEQIPTRKAKITTSSEPKLRTITTKKKTPPTEKSPPPPNKKKCPPGFAFAGSRGCVEMPSQKKRKNKGKSKVKSKQNLLSTKTSTKCVFGEKC